MIIASLWRQGEFKDRPQIFNNLKRVGFVFTGKSGKGKKGMVVETQNPAGFIPAEINGIYSKFLIYYPEPREAKYFMLASKHLRGGGFADTFPGCVGVISFTLGDPKASSRTANIYAMQGGFSQKKSQELSRALVSKHGGWREHLLDYFLKELFQKIFKP